MATEVECKIALGDIPVQNAFQTIDSVLSPQAKREEVSKKDLYWSTDTATPALFRVRESGDCLIITRKSKEERSDGVEVNDEIEFTTTAETDSVHSFFTSLGYIPLYRKEKQGWLWKSGNLTVELVEVSSLGWYVEMEILLDDGDGLTAEMAMDRLFSLREQIGLAHVPLEGRYYSEMLQMKSIGV